MTAPYFSKVPLRGWRATHVPLATPAYRVTRSFSLFSSVSLSLTLSPDTVHTSITGILISGGAQYRRRHGIPRSSVESSTRSSSLPPRNWFLWWNSSNLWVPTPNERPSPMHTTFNASPQLRKSPWRNVHRLASTGRMPFVSAMAIGKRVVMFLRLRRKCCWIYSRWDLRSLLKRTVDEI